jgi:hypothetical protein
VISPIDHCVEAFTFSQFGEADADRRSGDRCGEGACDVAEAAFCGREEGPDERADEFVAAVANEDVVGAKTLPQRRTQFLEETVSVGVTVRVVDSFQVVYVDERDDEGFTGSVCAIERVTELIAAGVA